MEFTIASQSSLDADLFLRCLWSQFRASFDNYGWNYWGIRNKNLVDLGLLNLGLKCPVHILYNYKQKGTINNLFLELDEEDLSEEVTAKIALCISKAKENKTLLKDYYCSSPIETFYEIQDYRGSNFEIEKSTFGENLLFKVLSFDKSDFDQEAAIKSAELIKFLSLVFKLPIFHGTNKSERIKSGGDDYSKELKTIDDFLGRYDLSSNVYNKIIEAITLYYNALKIIYNNRRIHAYHALDSTDDQLRFFTPSIHQELIDVQQKIKVDIEIAVVSLISAIEVAASIESFKSKACTTCSQQVYKIAQRVRAFSKKYGNEVIENNVKSAYSLRSQIVHVGILLEKQESYQGVTNPRLDLSQNGKLLKMAHTLPEILLEDVRFILLKFLEGITKDAAGGS